MTRKGRQIKFESPNPAEADIASELHRPVATSPGLADSTRERYLRVLDQWLQFAGTDPTGWTPTKAQDFYNDMLKRMQPHSAHTAISALQYASLWYSRRWQTIDFAAHVQMAKPRERSRKEPIPQEAIIRMLESCADLSNPIDARDFAIMVVFLETGMRRISLLDMDLSRMGEAAKATYPYPYAEVRLKGFHREDRYQVPLSDTALIGLKPWLSWLSAHSRMKDRGPVFRALIRRIDLRTGVLVYSPKTTALSAPALYKIIVDRGGTDEVHPHLFRHTFINSRISAGLTGMDISGITGHKPDSSGGNWYINLGILGAKHRNTTPAWLAEYVQRRITQ